MENLHKLIKIAASKRILYSIHALDEMNAESELITATEVKDVVYSGEIIEDYPEDKRGHSESAGINRHRVEGESPLHERMS